jgi:hypothetical protein
MFLEANKLLAMVPASKASCRGGLHLDFNKRWWATISLKEPVDITVRA